MLPRLEGFLRKRLVPALVDGGMGIEGISETEFYKFITSPDGLSQLGIEADQPPKLLEAYRRTFKISTRGRAINLKFGNVAKLKLSTPHPASGTGKLRIDSWLTWVVDGRTEPRGFVRRSRIEGSNLSAKRKVRLSSHIRLRSPLGGLMLKDNFLGSTGFWKFPTRFRNYDSKWLRKNAPIIQRVIAEEAFKILQIELR